MSLISVGGGTIPCPFPVVVTNPSEGGEGGGLTDVQLRASPVPISGTVNVGTVPVTGDFYPQTQAVSGTFWQATQPVSIAATVAVSGPLTDAQLRAVAVPVSGTFYPATQPVSIASMPSTPVTGTFWQATQPVSLAATVATQHLRDTGRAIVNAATAIAGVTAVNAEAMLTLNVSRNGAATAGGTSISVTSGKKLRIIGISAGIISTSAAVISGRVALRLNPNGAAATSSPIIAILNLSQKATALAQAGSENSIMFSEAIEISGTMQVGLSQLCSATTGTVWASLIAYEY